MKFCRAYFAALALLILSPVAAVSQVGQTRPAVEAANLAQIPLTSYGAYIHVQGTNSPGDGGDTYYYRNGLVCTPDGLNIIKDASGNCFYRGTSSASAYTVASVASVRAVSALTAAALKSITALDYYGTGFGCPISYSWNAADTRADDGGAVIAPTGISGAGRWNLNQSPKAPLHTCVYGVVVDSPVNSASIHTDNTTRVQAALAWANAYGPNAVYLDSAKGNCIGTSATLSLNGLEGIVIEGDSGPWESGQNPNGSCINFYGNSGPAINLQTPYPGQGTVAYKGPELRNFSIFTDIDNANNSSTGCVNFNSAAGGWTNDNTSQQPIEHPKLEGMVCEMGYEQANQNGFYCAKCFDGQVTNFYSQFGAVGVWFDGSDNMEINGSSRIDQPSAYHLKFTQEGGSAQFGNTDRMIGGQLLSITNAANIGDAFIYDSSISSSITNVFIENGTVATLSGVVHYAGGLSHEFSNNRFSFLTNVPMIEGNGPFENLTAIGNGGGVVNYPVFTNVTYWYNAGGVLHSQMVHYGNSDYGDLQWPLNSDYNCSPKGVDVTYVMLPGCPGLTTAGQGLSEKPVNNQWTLPTSGFNLYWDPISIRGATPLTGSHQAFIIAWASANGSLLQCQATDNGVTFGSLFNFTLTTSPQQYNTTANSASTSWGLNCGNGSTNSETISYVGIL